MRERDRLHSLCKTHNDPQLKDQYKSLRNQVLSESRKAKYQNDKKVDEKLRSTDVTNKDWWKYCNFIANGKRNNVNSPLFDGNKIITDDKQKANILNNYFESQSELDESYVMLPSAPEQDGPQI